MSKLSIGAGIAQGAQAFVNSFMQARQYESQQKMMKNQVILQALYHQLGDDNIPYRTRAQLIDSIPNLLGVKTEVPLSQQFGLHDLLDDDIEVEGAQAATPTTGQSAQTKTSAISAPEISSPDRTGVEMGVSDSGNELNTSIALQGKEAEAAKTVKMGDLSPAKYKQLLKTNQDKIDTERHLEVERRRAEINFDLQQRSWKAQGYTKEVARGVDEKTGRYRVLLANAEGDVKAIDMPEGFEPLEVLVARQRGANSALPSPIRAYEAYFQGQTNPLTGTNYTPEEAKMQALEHYKKHGDTIAGLNTSQKKLNLTKSKQEISGDKPLSAGELADNQRADRQMQVQQESNLITLQSKQTEAETALAEFDSILKTQEQTVKDLEYKFNGQGNDDSVAENYSPGDTEYQQAENALNRERQNLIELRNKRAGTAARAASAKQAAEAYAKTIGSGGTSNVSISQGQIDTFRKNNANNPRVRAMNDEEIKAVLIRNKNKWTAQTK